jgi:hypothetical protein
MLSVQGLRKGLPALLIACALSACGPNESQNGQLVSDGSIVISPPTLDIDLSDPTGMATCTPGTDASLFPIVISTFDSRGFLLGNVDISVVLSFAPNTSTQVAMTLFDENNVEVTSATSPIPYETTTDSSGNTTGTKRLFLLADTSIACSYTSFLTVISGSIVSFMEITATGS